MGTYDETLRLFVEGFGRCRDGLTLLLFLLMMYLCCFAAFLHMFECAPAAAARHFRMRGFRVVRMGLAKESFGLCIVLFWSVYRTTRLSELSSGYVLLAAVY